MKINVTKQNILNGKARNNQTCPIACSIKEKDNYYSETKIEVNEDEIEIYTPQSDYRVYKLPQIAQDFIENFDKSKIKDRNKFKSFSFRARLIH